MNGMIVRDYLLDCCIEYGYNEIFTYPNELFEDPEINVSENYIKYNWTNKLFNLYPGETLTIQYNTNVTDYCYIEVDNYVYVDLWNTSNTSDTVHLYGNDSATVNCIPPDPSFEKKVKDPETDQWVEDTFQYVNETVTYLIELSYYGNYNLTDVRIVDYLPYITDYDGGANIQPTNISEDKKTVWWNLTDLVEDGEPLEITFNAVVKGSTGDCEDCGINLAEFTAYENVTQEPFYDEDTANITTDYYADPELAFSPNFIYFGIQDQGWTGSSTFNIWNSGEQTLNYQINENISWLQVSPTSGSSTGEQDTITVSVTDTSQLSGFYGENIAITSNGGSGNIFIALYINPPIPEPEINLTITIPKKIFLGKVNAVIKNVGETDVSDVNWEINLTAGIRKKLYTVSGTIDEIKINLNEQVSTGKSFLRTAIKFKFGRVIGTITASVGDYSTSIDFSGLALGRIIIIRSFTAPV